MKYDDFYKRLRRRVAGWADERDIRPSYRDALLALPDLFHLICRMLLDKRLGAVDKGVLGVAIAYVVAPLDMIPDFLGPLGFVDDLIVVAIALDTVFKRVPRELVDKHWAGETDVIALVRKTVAQADDWFGKGLLRRVRTYLRKVGALDEPEPGKPETRAAPAGGKKTAASKASTRTRKKAAAGSRPRARKRRTKTT